MTDKSLPKLDWRVVFNRAAPRAAGGGDACARRS